jgi:hypothetical protein
VPRLRFTVDAPRRLGPDLARLGAAFHDGDRDARTAIVTGFEHSWRAIEPSVFASYERLSGRRFRHEEYACHAASSLDISGYTSPLRRAPPLICVRAIARDAELTTTVVHELGHVLTIDNPWWHLRMMLRIWLRHRSGSPSQVASHVLINLLHEEVLRQTLPDPEDAISIARGWRGLQRPWRIIDTDGLWVRGLVLRRAET